VIPGAGVLPPACCAACPGFRARGRGFWVAVGREWCGPVGAVGSPDYGPDALRDDFARFRFLLGVTDGEGVFTLAPKPTSADPPDPVSA